MSCLLSDGELIHNNCLLSNEPFIVHCIVLLVEGDDTFIWYCHPGHDKWVKHQYDVETITLPYEYNESYLMKIPICPIIACLGKFDFNGTSEDLVVLEFCPAPVFSSIAVDDNYEEEAHEEEAHAYEGGRERDSERWCSSCNWATSSIW